MNCLTALETSCVGFGESRRFRVEGLVKAEGDGTVFMLRPARNLAAPPVMGPVELLKPEDRLLWAWPPPRAMPAAWPDPSSAPGFQAPDPGPVPAPAESCLKFLS